VIPPEEETGSVLATGIADMYQKLKQARAITTALLKRVGTPGQCKGCQRPIVWVRDTNDHGAPYDADGVSHFATCPKAQEFRKK
jgi:hypothetical protein